MYDIVIVGAGPAGSTLAASLGCKKRVLLLDKRSMNNPAHFDARTEKCCGGLLNPDAQDALTRLQIGVPKAVLTEPQVFAVRAIDFDNGMERFYPKRYVNIDRTAFDRYLVRRAEAQPFVSLREEVIVQNFEEKKNYVTVRLFDRRTGQVEDVKTRLLVGADGASSIIRTRLSERYLVPVSGDRLSGAPRNYTCIQEHFWLKEPMPYHVAAFDRFVTDYYSWAIPKGDRLIVGSAIPEGPDTHLKFAKLKADLISKGFVLGEPVYRSGAKLLRPRPFGSTLTGRGHVFLCGEAAGLISPSSSEGISYAIRSGDILGKVLSGELADAKKLRVVYEKKLRKLKTEITLKSGKSPIMYNKYLRGTVFRTRVLSIETEV